MRFAGAKYRIPLLWAASSSTFLPNVVHAACISLQNSNACSKYHAASFDQGLRSYPFLAALQDVDAFDRALDLYISTSFYPQKFLTQFSCPTFNFSASYYARFTKTVLCASIVQQSIASCGLKSASVPTVCASTCADYAESEAALLTSSYCSLGLTDSTLEAVRHDYDLCSTPGIAYSSSSCVDGLANEPDRCGFGTNTEQLCAFCTSGTTNTTNSCCQVIGNTTCLGVPLQPLPPRIIPSPIPPTPQASKKLSTGTIVAIALCIFFGIVGLLSILAVVMLRRRRRASSVRDRLESLHHPLVAAQHDQADPADHPFEPTTMTITACHDDVPTSPGTTEPFDPASRRTTTTTLDPDFDPEKSVGSPASTPRRTTTVSPFGVYGTSLPINRSQISLSASSIATDRPISFVDQYSGLRIAVGSIVRCIHDYEPVLPDELRIRRGDVIRVTEVFDDRWCKGITLRSGSKTPLASGSGSGSEPRESSSSSSQQQQQQAITTEERAEARAFPIVCVCAENHDSATASTTPTPSFSSPSSSSGTPTPVTPTALSGSPMATTIAGPGGQVGPASGTSGIGRSIGTAGGRDSPGLPPVLEESKESTAGEEEGSTGEGLKVSKKTSISRFKEHMGPDE